MVLKLNLFGMWCQGDYNDGVLFEGSRTVGLSVLDITNEDNKLNRFCYHLLKNTQNN